jgi:hypothetical protein
VGLSYLNLCPPNLVGAEEAAGEAGHPGVSCPQGAQRQLGHVQLGGPREEGLPPTRVRVLSQKPGQRVYEQQVLSRKPGFLLSAMHSHTFRWFSAAPLLFVFLGLLPLQLNQIWRIFCVMYGEEGGWTFLDCLQKL